MVLASRGMTDVFRELLVLELAESPRYVINMNAIIAPCLAVAMLAVAAVGVASAQSVTISGTSALAQHPLLGESLLGASIAIRTREAPTTFQFEVSHARARSGRIGAPCAGLIRPGSCPPEPLRDDARLLSASGGGALRVLRAERVSVSLTGDLSLASVRADTRGETSGGRLSASKTLWGGTLGARADWTPLTRLPLALELGVGIGTLSPIREDDVVDGYTPFESHFEIRHAQAGVRWRFRH
jgi:hypothetical protein